MAKRSRNTPKGIETATGENVTYKTCRRCLNKKRPTEYHQALDYFLDRDGLFSICKDCTYEIYDIIYQEEKTVEKALLKMTQVLNIPFVKDSVDSVAEDVLEQDSGKRKMHPYSLYTMKIKSIFRDRNTDGAYPTMELTFSEEIARAQRINLKDEDNVDNEFWGDGFSARDVEFLDSQYEFFKDTVSIETHAEIILLKRVCVKILLIRKEEGKSEPDFKLVSSLESDLQKLMKSLAISPEKVQDNNSGESQRSFGNWIKIIEKKTPAEWLKEDAVDIYEDVDNVELYYENFFKRPLRNLISGIADFKIKLEDGTEEDWGV